MDSGGVSEIQHSKLVVFVFHDPTVSKVDLHDSLVFGTGNVGDVAHVAVVDLLVVLDLHDLIAKPEA